MSTKLKALMSARVRYEQALAAYSDEVARRCDFEASVQFIDGDGFVILNQETDVVAPIDVIYRKRRLTEDEHANESF